tara:strand:- start:757 stop:1119 length:363 start_codon:yes stop_codon:yes gene_type:complete
MKKLLMMCSALAIVASSSDAAVRVATVIHVENYQQQCQRPNNDLLGSMIFGAILGKIVTGNDRGAAVGALLGTSMNNNVVCSAFQRVYWRAESYGRLYQGSFNSNRSHYLGQRIHVDGLP